jgi:hypothetical protein
MTEILYVGNSSMLSHFIVSLPRYRWYFLTVMVALVPLIRFHHQLEITPAYLHNVSEYVPAYFEPFRGSSIDRPDAQFAINFMKLVFPCWIVLWFGMRALEWNPDHTSSASVLGSTLKMGSILFVSACLSMMMVLGMMIGQAAPPSSIESIERLNIVYYHINFEGESYSADGVYICDRVQQECEAVFSRRNSHLTIEENGYEVRILENDRVLYLYSDS